MAIADTVRTGVVNAAGVGELSVSAFGRQRWTVKQVTVNGLIAGATSVGPQAACALYKNGILITGMLPLQGVAVEPPPISIAGNDRLFVRWTAATVGAAIEMLVIYDDGQEL